ncbi:MAG: hypothetical protein H6727_02720 [Myxococcales bacterium]|nr:hypothetical protein [Myxococcales bacterium]
MLITIGLTFWLRRQVRRILKPLSERISSSTNTQTLWQTLWLGLKILYDHLPLLIAYAALWLIINLVDAPENWENLVITLALIWVLYRTTLTFVNLLFHRATSQNASSKNSTKTPTPVSAAHSKL